MCGVFATTRPDLWRDRVTDVLRALDHRGPDAQGAWESPDGLALLAHTRLAIIGLDAAGAQPSFARSGEVGLCFNGEIYNYRELAAEMGLPDARSDTAVLAELLGTDGPGGVGRLRGMWAFAAWDSRNATLIAGRDPFGIKPLYVLHHAGGGVTVCSEIPPLLLLDEARAVDPIGLAQYVAFGHTGPDVTMFERIRKLPPGAVLHCRAGAQAAVVRIERPAPTPYEPRGLRAAVEDAVRAHLIADVEVGVFLSGGIDSTLIAAIAHRALPGLRTFTLSFPDTPKLDESAMAARNAEMIGTSHRTIAVRTTDMVGAARRFVEVQGEPFGDAAALPLTLLAHAVRDDLKVVLTGEGADELFGGYGRYRVSRRVGGTALRVARPLTSRGARWWGERRGDAPRSRALEALAWGGGARTHAALLGSDLTCLLNHDVPHATEVRALADADWRTSELSLGAGSREEETARRFDQTRWRANTYLEKVDRATMAHSVEARVPYLDPVVAATAGAMPVDPFKSALRAELEQLLPGVVLPSRKKGLAVSLTHLLAGGLDDQRRRVTDSRDSVLATHLGRASARVLADRAERSPLTAFRLAMLGLWEESMRSASLL